MELLKYLDTESDKLHEENISSSDEFRTVNHSFVEGFNYALAIVQGFEVELNENQQVVLEWLKKKYKTTDIEPIELIWRLRVNSNSDKWRLQPPYKNYRYLTEIAQFQLLVAFAEWGMKQC